jgi:hypothetical protein
MVELGKGWQREIADVMLYVHMALAFLSKSANQNLEFFHKTLWIGS